MPILGQVAAVAGASPVTLFTASGETTVSSLTICAGGTAATFTISVVPSGATLGAPHLLSNAVSISANTTVALVLGLTLSKGDRVLVSCATAALAFHAYGLVM